MRRPILVKDETRGIDLDPPAHFIEMGITKKGRCLLCGHISEPPNCCICHDCICCTREPKTEEVDGARTLERLVLHALRIE